MKKAKMMTQTVIAGVLFAMLFCMPSAMADSDSAKPEDQRPGLSPSIIPQPNQTLERTKMTYGDRTAVCQRSGAVASKNECRAQGCYTEVQAVSDSGESVKCYQCSQKTTVGEGCGQASGCPGGLTKATGKKCEMTCGSATMLDSSTAPREGRECVCKSVVQGKCYSGGERSTTCGQMGGANDLVYEASSELKDMGGGVCIPLCSGSPKECGS